MFELVVEIVVTEVNVSNLVSLSFLLFSCLR